jgi:hypothetical protein
MGEICDLIDKVTGCGVGTIEKTKISKASYYRISISLTKPLDNVKLSIAGEYLTVAKIKGYASCKLRFNHSNATLIDLREIREIKGHFDEVYFTTDGQDYECIIYVATSPNSTIRTGEALKTQGGIVNYYTTSTDYVRRFAAIDILMNEWHMRNMHNLNSFLVGGVDPDSLPDIATFRGYAFQVVNLYTFKLGNVNLQTLGYSTNSNGNFCNIQCIGTLNE